MSTPADRRPPETARSSVASIGHPLMRWAVALLLIGILLARANLAAVARTLLDIAGSWLAILTLVTVGWLLLGALNVWLLLRPAAPPLAVFTGVYLTSWLAATLLPGQLGDAIQLPLLRRHGTDIARSGAAYLVDKSMSLLWLGGVGAAGAALYAPRIVATGGVIAAGTLLVLSLLGLVLVLRLRGRSGWRARLVETRDRLLAELRRLAREPLRLALNFAITLCRWALTTALYWFGFRACGFVVPLVAAATLPFLVSLVGYLPISIGGLGTMEWVAVGLFSFVGASATTVLAVYLLLRAVPIAVALVGLLFLAPRALGTSRPA